MTVFLWIGTLLGAVIGLIHAAAIFKKRLTLTGGQAAQAAYYSLWTFFLWSLFGAYLLAFWILGSAFLVLSRLTGGGRASQ